MNQAAFRSAIRHRLMRARALTRHALPFASGMAAVLVALWLYRALVPAPPQITTADVDTAISDAMASATPAPAFSSLAYSVIRPSLVFVQSSLTDQNNTRASLSGIALAEFRPAAYEGVGSGVIVNDQGDILTSLHVVAGASSIQVTFADGSQSDAKVVGAQAENDIAVLNASQLPDDFIPATLANPNAMRVGDEAYVVGSPFGLYGSMSAGVISGFERTLKVPHTDLTLEHLIQVDAAVNPGNSGGPLLNRAGQVVGIVTAFFNPTQQDVFVGVGFAVPITTAGGAAGAPPV